ncbi:MAG: hypothetical protein FD153_549 [Rhodospirillaceae bacterium]|nr:MAG: hypothetical protein FD153_549 [Rhodospirillaceae bacterium]
MKTEVPLAAPRRVARWAAALGFGLAMATGFAAARNVACAVEMDAVVAAAADSNAGARRKQSLPKKPDPAESVISPFEAECVWLGKRIVSLLKREDVDTAQTFDRFYTIFGCPMPHLGKAFGCVVASESDREAIEGRIDRCWTDPYTRLPIPPSPYYPQGITRKV